MPNKPPDLDEIKQKINKNKTEIAHDQEAPIELKDIKTELVPAVN